MSQKYQKITPITLKYYCFEEYLNSSQLSSFPEERNQGLHMNLIENHLCR